MSIDDQIVLSDGQVNEVLENLLRQANLDAVRFAESEQQAFSRQSG